MSNLFADYRPREGARGGPVRPPTSLVVRDAAEADVECLARIAHQRNGGEFVEHVAGFERSLRNRPNAPDNVMLTALVDDRIVGYAKAGVFVPPGDAPPNCAPPGWYLWGVTIVPEMRRRGIGLELTRARLDRIARRADRAHYFASAMNRASIDLHAQLGFVETTRDFWYPRMSFTGGVGILFRVDLRGPRGA